MWRNRQLIVAMVALFACAVAAMGQTRPTTRAPYTPLRWEKDIAAYEAKDREHAPGKGGILFTGASTIRMWKSLEQDFPDRPVLNRGFGGSMVADATFFAERIIFPYEPKQIFLRAGGNDIHIGRSVDQVFKDYKEFVATVRAKLPDAQIVYISMSPAPARWEERDKNKQLNGMIEEYSKQTPGLKYCDVYDMTLTPQGEAREELFIADKLHFNADGYKLLAERVRPFLAK